MFKRLPEAESPIREVRIRLLRGPAASATFWEALDDAVVPEHSHGDQWGIVVEGELSLTIGRETRMYRRGDEYFIPAGTPHSARLPRGLRVIDVFDDPDRFRARP